MHGAGNFYGTLVSWSEFVLFQVLPIAVAQIYDWLREWQILVAVILALAAFHFWSRAILRAARQTAKETVHNETRSLDAGLKLLRRQIETRPGQEALPPAPAAGIPAAPPPAEEGAGSPLDCQAAIARLRQAIRLALGTIPLSDEPLSPDGMRLYRAAIDALPEADDAEGTNETLARIASELTSLQQGFPPPSCRQAWQSLVKVNTLAREFQEPAQEPAMTRAEVLAATLKPTP